MTTFFSSQSKFESSGHKLDGLVIWLHGLAGTGDEFAMHLRSTASSLPHLASSFPDAPIAPVTFQQGRKMRSWFDIETLPIAPNRNHKGLQESVSLVHAMIQESEKKGIHPRRIFLAGFSQGATLSLIAGLTYPHRIGGICMFGGWASAGLPVAPKHPETPILICHGSDDAVVPLKVAHWSLERLAHMGCSSLRFVEYHGLDHTLVREQLDDAKEFLRSVPASCTGNAYNAERARAKEAVSTIKVVSGQFQSYSNDRQSWEAHRHPITSSMRHSALTTSNISMTTALAAHHSFALVSAAPGMFASHSLNGLLHAHVGCSAY